MEVYKTIKNDLLLLCLIALAISIIRAYLNIGVDDTAKYYITELEKLKRGAK